MCLLYHFQVEEVGTLLMAVNNLAEQCHISSYGPLEDMSMLTKMDMVKVQNKLDMGLAFRSCK